MRYPRAFTVCFSIFTAAYMGYGAERIQPRTVASSPAVGLPLTGFVHVQDLGDLPLRDGVWAGTKGQSRRLEGFSVNFAAPVPGLGLAYICHLQDGGDTPWMPGGSFCGTKGQSRRLEGFAIRLAGANAASYDVFYECHVQDIGDMGPVKNGAFCGTRGQSRRVEAILVWVKANAP
jgi:uncharacterized protein YjdB